MSSCWKTDGKTRPKPGNVGKVVLPGYTKLRTTVSTIGKHRILKHFDHIENINHAAIL